MSANIRLDIDRFRTSDRPQSLRRHCRRLAAEPTEGGQRIPSSSRRYSRWIARVTGPIPSTRIPQLDDRAHSHQALVAKTSSSCPANPVGRSPARPRIVRTATARTVPGSQPASLVRRVQPPVAHEEQVRVGGLADVAARVEVHGGIEAEPPSRTRFEYVVALIQRLVRRERRTLVAPGAAPAKPETAVLRPIRIWVRPMRDDDVRGRHHELDRERPTVRQFCRVEMFGDMSRSVSSSGASMSNARAPRRSRSR